jgi:hypothetical protein
MINVHKFACKKKAKSLKVVSVLDQKLFYSTSLVVRAQAQTVFCLMIIDAKGIPLGPGHKILGFPGPRAQFEKKWVSLIFRIVDILLICAIFEGGLDLIEFDLILLVPYVFSDKFRILEYRQICGMFEDGFDFSRLPPFDGIYQLV